MLLAKICNSRRQTRHVRRRNPRKIRPTTREQRLDIIFRTLFYRKSVFDEIQLFHSRFINIRDCRGPHRIRESALYRTILRYNYLNLDGIGDLPSLCETHYHLKNALSASGLSCFSDDRQGNRSNKKGKSTTRSRQFHYLGHHPVYRMPDLRNILLHHTVQSLSLCVDFDPRK